MRPPRSRRRTDARSRHRAQPVAASPWTLQRRLIVTVVGIMSLIMVLVAVATSAILGSVLEDSLDSR